HGHVLQPAVGAGADDHLVDLDLAHFGDGVGVLRQVGEGHGGLDGAKVNLHGADVLGVGVGLVGGVGAVHPAVQVGPGDVVHGEDAVLGPGLDGHVGDAQPVVHGQ